MQSTGWPASCSCAARTEPTAVTSYGWAAARSASAISRAASGSSSTSSTRAGMAVLLPEGDDGVPERVHPGRLHLERARARVACGGGVLVPIGLTEDQDRDRAQTRVGGEMAEHRGRVHVGQMEVEHDERRSRRVHERRAPVEERECLGAVLDRVDDERVREHGAHGAQKALVVVHHQHVDRHHARSSAGRWSVKQLPRPGADSTSTLPRCASTTRFTIASPTPEPAAAAPSTTCSASGTRPKTSKMFRWYAGGMPIPLSRTDSVANPLSTPLVTSIRPWPAGTYFSALPSRFEMACASFHCSPRTRGSGPTTTCAPLAAICGR